MRLVDLSHTIDDRMITYSGLPGPRVGIDSVNIDDTSTGEPPAHTLLLGAGIPIVEHLTNLAGLPATGARFTAVPPAIRGLATFPVRAFAAVPVPL